MEEKEDLKLIGAKFDRINERIDALKQVIIDYLTLGNEFARGALKTSLEKV